MTKLVALETNIGMAMAGKNCPRLMVTTMSPLVAVETTIGMAMAGKIGPKLMLTTTSPGKAHNMRVEVATICKIITTKIGPTQVTMAMPIMTGAADPGIN